MEALRILKSLLMHTHEIADGKTSSLSVSAVLGHEAGSAIAILRLLSCGSQAHARYTSASYTNTSDFADHVWPRPQLLLLLQELQLQRLDLLACLVDRRARELQILALRL